MVVISVIEEYPYEIVASDEQAARQIAEQLFSQEGNDQRDYREMRCRGANVGLSLLILGSMFALWSKMADISAQIVQHAGH
jgi:hypothetical protein